MDTTDTLDAVHLVFDANEVSRDFMMTGFCFQLVGFLAARGVLRAHVPSPVRLEIIANYARRLEEARLALQKAQRLLAVLGKTGTVLPTDSAPPYPGYLRDRMEALNISVLPWPSISHEDLTTRATERRAPFNATGGGYRDSIVWASCVELAESGVQVILVSSDKAFASKEGGLLPELDHELGDNQGRVRLARSLSEWLDDNRYWQNLDARESAALVRELNFVELFAPWDMFEDMQFDVEELGLPESVRIKDVAFGSFDDFSTIDDRRLEDGVHRLTQSFSVDYEVEAIVNYELAESLQVETTETGVIGRVECSIPVTMDALMVVIFDPRKDLETEDSAEDGGWPYEIDSIEWLPRVIRSATGPVLNPGPEQPMLELD